MIFAHKPQFLYLNSPLLPYSMTNSASNQAQTEREKYILAWNDTMINIWKEQITLLGVIDTGRLLQSPIKLATRADGTIQRAYERGEFHYYNFLKDKIEIVHDVFDLRDEQETKKAAVYTPDNPIEAKKNRSGVRLGAQTARMA